MRIPVFVSCPTALGRAQETSRKLILRELRKLGLEPRALGRSDYPIDLPLREIYVLATHCSGGLILGFEQFQAKGGTFKRGSSEARTTKDPIPFPTSWNHLEAGILYSLGIPLLVFKEKGISGGVFDLGVTDLFVHQMPAGKLSSKAKEELSAVFMKWGAKVRAHYYGD